MREFEQNNCRICKKVFCCKDCRLKHEEKVHQINTDCDICIFGKISTKPWSLKLKRHILAFHCPLFCLKCNKMFSTDDDLTHHDKCTSINNSLKSPKTPINSIVDDFKTPSSGLTPFYKNDNSTNKNNRHITLSITKAICSTPLLPRDNLYVQPLLTPASGSCILYKSSLKLTGSSYTLNGSKKSERRVTFSETSIIDPARSKLKILQNKRSDLSSDCDTNDLFVSASETNDYAKYSLSQNDSYKTAPSTTVHIEDIENQTNSYLLSKVQLQVEEDEAKDEELPIKASSIWSSVTNMMHSVFQNISMSNNHFPSNAAKRALPLDHDFDVPKLKRMKMSDIKCRRPLRQLTPIDEIRLVSKKYVDKATQTDE